MHSSYGIGLFKIVLVVILFLFWLIFKVISRSIRGKKLKKLAFSE